MKLIPFRNGEAISWRASGSIPGWGTKILHAVFHGTSCPAPCSPHPQEMVMWMMVFFIEHLLCIKSSRMPMKQGGGQEYPHFMDKGFIWGAEALGLTYLLDCWVLVVASRPLIFLVVRGILFPDQGSNLGPLHFLSTESEPLDHQGGPWALCFNSVKTY